MVRTRNLVMVGNREVKKRYVGNKLIFENLRDKTEILSGEEVHTDKGDDSVVHVEVDGKSYQHAGSGKNLFTIPYPDALEGFIRPVDYWVKPITLKADTQYTISSRLIGNSIKGTIIMVWNGGDWYADRGTSYIFLSLVGVHRTHVFNTGDVSDWKIAIYLTAHLESSKELLGQLLDNYQFQLEEGSVVTEYEPPAPTPDNPIEIHSLNDFDVVSQKSEGGTINKINISLSEPLRSVGDVKDRIFRDSDGLWKIERKTRERTLDGSETWEQYLSHNQYHIPSTDAKSGSSLNSKSTHFKGKRFDDRINFENNTIAIGGTSRNIAIFTSDFSSVAELRSWLSLNKPKILYELENAQIEVLDPELQDKLNNLRSFEDSNYVYTITNEENLKPTLHTTFKSKGWYDYYLKTLKGA